VAMTWRVISARPSATVVESLPLNAVVDDNISVPVTALVFGTLMFGF